MANDLLSLSRVLQTTTPAVWTARSDELRGCRRYVASEIGPITRAASKPRGNEHVLGPGAVESLSLTQFRRIKGTSTEGGVMFGRLVELEGLDPSKREEALGTIRERIIPGLKEIDGFAGFISLVDEENRRARSIVLWETKEGADEAERKFAQIREETVRGMGGTVRSADLFEAPIVEVLAGVRA
jgi:hypothetical protein